MPKSLFRSNLSPTDFASFMHVCAAVANEAADENGFVALRRLLSRFQAELVIRPLLVEAMLAVREHKPSDTSIPASWALLLDSTTHKISPLELEDEAYKKPLGARLRNTVAHELAHSLAFRPTEFGIKLQTPYRDKESRRAFVQAVEQETERLSPLLLLPEKALATFLLRDAQPLTLDEVKLACRSYGVSRHVLINRLRLLRYVDDQKLSDHPRLQNIALLFGQWTDDRGTVLRKWPIFSSFDRNIIPAFLHKLADEDMLPLDTIFPQNAMAGAARIETISSLTVNAGTAASPDVEKMNIECCIEATDRKGAQQFLILIRKVECPR